MAGLVYIALQDARLVSNHYTLNGCLLDTDVIWSGRLLAEVVVAAQEASQRLRRINSNASLLYRLPERIMLGGRTAQHQVVHVHGQEETGLLEPKV